MSHLPVNDPVTSMIWLEVCFRLATERPKNLRFSAFLIGEGQLRPFSFQVFDKKRVHVGLRGYSPFRAPPTLSSAILPRNSQIATLFANDFEQSFRSVGLVDVDKRAELVKGLGTLDEVARQQVETTVRALLASPTQRTQLLEHAERSQGRHQPTQPPLPPDDGSPA